MEGGSTLTECRAFGVAPKEHAELIKLTAILRGLCTRVGTFDQHEIVMRVKLPPREGGAPFTHLRLSRPISKDEGRQGAGRLEPKQPSNPFADPLPERWLVTHEGLPMMGQVYRELPAALREITESHCASHVTPDFWKALGAEQEYEMRKTGHEYHCLHAGFEIRVLLVNIRTLAEPGNLNSAQTVSARYVVDVSTRVSEKMHTEGALAIGSFGAKLAPLVMLQAAVAPT